MRVGVFCGSSSGNDPSFSGFARQTGRFLAESSIEVVYGGGRVGLMGGSPTACSTPAGASPA